MHTSQGALALSVFLASAVEMVEALTIVVAVGATRGWRSALSGAGAAIALLIALVATCGPALVHLVPLGALRLFVGVLLLVFGMQWLRKAILRSAGVKAKHDEDAIFAETAAALSSTATPGSEGRSRRLDQQGVGVAFKGVLLEGLEVVVLVITLGAAQHALALASLAAGAAAVVVGGVGAVVARQLAGVPENALKMTVGLMLVSFGTFWVGEGLGVRWPGSDLAIPGLAAVYGLLAWLMVTLARPPAPSRVPGPIDAGATGAPTPEHA